MKLTKEQAEKLKALNIEEEIKDFIDSERIELSPEDLEAISGGGLLDIIGDAIGNALENLLDALS